MPLKESHKAFCKEYILDWNGTRAYQKAYPKVEYDTAKVNASKLLTKANIQAYIQELQKDLEKVAGISRLRVMKELESIAFSSMHNYHKNWMELEEYNSLTKEQLSAIASIEHTTINSKDGSKEIVKFKLHDKQRAIDSLNRMLGYNEPEEIKGSLKIKEKVSIKFK